MPPTGHPEVIPVKYDGIDVHKRMCQAAVRDDQGEAIEETRFTKDQQGVEEFADPIPLVVARYRS